ncbi:MAG: hypothetical protein RI571_05280 [Roseovarius sp.]|nr:hypothetical protein [Roseovarius sp.]
MTTKAPAPPGSRRDALIPALRQALEETELSGITPTLMPDKGLAHDHLTLPGTGWIARIPKQSQMNLSAEENLAYQTACFDRASQSGHAPRLHSVLPPSVALPRGGLIVEKISGRAASLPGDLPAIMDALAAIHRLPLPDEDAREPLLTPSDPLKGLLDEIAAQSGFVTPAGVHDTTRQILEKNIARLKTLAEREERPPRSLISFDAHPGNFLIDATGHAFLVDLEKARYSAAPLDLAHATLYTSTTWDTHTQAVLSAAETAGACLRWLDRLPETGRENQLAWILPLRRAMWLWSMTWCAKWRVLSDRDPASATGGEDWAAQNSEIALIKHVRGRVDHYLEPGTAAHVDAEFDELADRLLQNAK